MNPSIPTESANSALEFHDSEVSSVEGVTSGLQVRFAAAYVHSSEGTPGVDSGEVFLQPIDIHLRDVVGWTDIFNQCKGELSGGELKVDGDLISLVPLPFERAGNITLRLQFSDGTVFAAKGASVQVLQTGTRKFVERFGGTR